MAKKTLRVLAIVGSPRKKGNCDVLCDRVIAGARSVGAQVEKVYLHGLDIKPCSACEACHDRRLGRCVIEDDMAPLYRHLRECDAIILASPIYFFSVSAQTKLFMDRLYPLADGDGLKLGAKRAVCCLTFGEPELFRSGCRNAVGTLDDAFGYANIPVQYVYGAAHEKGSIRADKAAMRKAYALGKSLAQ